MKKIFTLIASALIALSANAQVVDVAGYTVDSNSKQYDSKKPEETTCSGTGCSVQIHAVPEDRTEASGVWGAKLDSESKYIQIDLDEALQEGDEVSFSYFMGSNIPSDGSVPGPHGIQISNLKPDTEGYVLLATMEATATDKKNVITKAYTAVGGEKKFLVYKISTSNSVYFSAIKVTRGSNPQSEAKAWNFTQLSSADAAAFAADATNWEVKSGDNVSGWANKTVLTTRNVYTALKANGTELEITNGLQFTRDNNSGLDAGKIFFKNNTALNIAGNNCLVKIPGLVKNDVVKVRFVSNGDESRGFTLTNTDKTSIMSENKADVQEATLTVTADGDVTMKSTKSVNIIAMSLNQDLPTAVQGVAEAKVAKVAAPAKVVKNGQIFIGNYTVAGAQVK